MVSSYWITLTDSKLVKQVKSALEEEERLNKKLKISSQSGRFTIPIVCSSDEESDALLEKIRLKLTNIELNVIKKEDTEPGNSNTLNFQFEKLLDSFNTDSKLILQLLSELPKRYSIYPPLLLLPSNSLDTAIWMEYLKSISEEQRTLIYKLMLDFYSTPTNKFTHLAINKPIPKQDNVIRTPMQLTILYGDFSNFWCHTIQNGIYQTWMPLHTMFSRGNIKEKARILTDYKDISNVTDIIDMYVGIGYFTLSYLKRGAKRLFCWEINSRSVEGLARNVKKNGFGDPYVIQRNEPVILEKVLCSRCIIFLESNEYCLDRFKELLDQENDNLKLNLNITHINLGLLPTSTDSWPYTCKLIDLYGINSSDAWVHVHENIGISDLDTFMELAAGKLQELTNTRNVRPIWLEKVKTFAPDVYHIVGDFVFEKL